MGSQPSDLPADLARPDIDWWCPAGNGLTTPAWGDLGERVTHLGIGAHPDDLEFSFLHGIEACFEQQGRGFAGVTVTHGGGSLRLPGQSAEELIAVRRREQRAAAEVGRYALLAQLGYASADLAESSRSALLVAELTALLAGTRPAVVYLHAPTDRHRSHLAVLRHALAALRRLPRDQRPTQVWGCEGWRDLDWLSDADRVALPVGRREHLGAALAGLFDSQIASGKRYDLAVAGRRRAHASFSDPRGEDPAAGITLAVDLTPLIQRDDLSLEEFVDDLHERFRAECRAQLEAARLPGADDASNAR
ncbi:MAG: PIG-L deacetylase family protein [Planctomycetota bacterium]|jgi:LmbE family N-acetylglucosaminyl deacetylase